MTTARGQWSGHVDVATYRDRDGRLVAVDDKNNRLQEDIKLDAAGLPVAIDEYALGFLGARMSIEWRGGRPRHVAVDVKGPVLGSVTRDFIYVCPE